MTDRIVDAIERAKAKVDALTEDKRNELDSKMGATFQELVAWQDIKSLAQANGLLNVDEAMTVYAILGGEAPSPEKFAKQPLPEKIVVTQLMWELSCSMRLHTDKVPKSKGRRR